MSDSEHAAAPDDLFGDSDNEAPPVISASATASPNRAVSPVASSSRGSPRLPAKSGTASPAPEGDIDDLFGDDDDEPPPPVRTRTASSAPTSRSNSAPPRDALEYDEEEGEQEVQETWANKVIPTWNRLGGKDGKAWHLKLPAYINIEPKPFDHALYRSEIDPEEAEKPLTGLAAKSRMMGVKNTIRWRWVRDEQGNYKKQSNAKILRWSDGTSSLQLGSDLYDIATPAGTSLGPTPSSSSAPPQSQSQPQSQAQANDALGVTYICAAIGSAGVLMAEAPLAGQLSLVPTSMNSKTHMELVRHVGQQHTKHSKLKILDEVVGDPEIVAAAAAGAKRRAGGGGGGKRRMPAGSGMGGGGKGRRRGGRRGSDEESEDELMGGGGGGRYKDYEDDGFVVDDSDDDESDGARGKKGKRRGSSDEEGEYRAKGGKSNAGDGEKRRSGRKRKEEEELDEIELAERDIEERERERKRARKGKKEKKTRDYDSDDEPKSKKGGKGKSAKEKEVPVVEEDAEGEEEDMEMDMDVESEEE